MELIKKYYLSLIKKNVLEVFNYHNNFSRPTTILKYISDFMYQNTPCSSCDVKEELEDGSYCVVLYLYDSKVTIDFDFISYSGTTSCHPTCSFKVQASIKNLEVTECLF